MAIEAVATASERGRLFPTWVIGGWNKVGPLLVYFGFFVLTTQIRNYGDTHGLPIHRDFNAIEAVLLTDAPNRWLQAALLDVGWLRTASAMLYLSYMALPIFAVIALMFDRRHGQQWHVICFILIVIFSAMPFFYLYPLEPPWLHSAELARVQDVVRPGTSAADNNLYAAMPSLHIAKPMAVTLWFGLHSRVGKLFGVYTALMVFVVVYNGDHYVADVVAGLALAVAVYKLVGWLRIPILMERDGAPTRVTDMAAARLTAESPRRRAA